MKQRFSDKHPILGLLLFAYGGFVVSELLVGVIATFIVSPNGLEPSTVTAIGSCIGSILVLLFWYFINRKEYHFMPRKGDISGSFRLIVIPMLVYWVLLFGSYAYFCKGFPFAPISLKQIFMALMAGLVEEICFREVAVSFMAKHWMSEKNIPVIVIASGFMFGLIHITNGFSLGIMNALFQALLCIFFGSLYAAVYLRKGNVWVLCLFHFVHDILAFMGVAAFQAKGIAELPDWITLFIGAIELILCIVGFYYVRKAKRAEIVDFWKYKWSKDNTAE